MSPVSSGSRITLCIKPRGQLRSHEATHIVCLLCPNMFDSMPDSPHLASAQSVPHQGSQTVQSYVWALAGLFQGCQGARPGVDLILLTLLTVPEVPVLVNSPGDASISAGYAGLHLRLQLIRQLNPQHQLSEFILLRNSSCQHFLQYQASIAGVQARPLVISVQYSHR